jgi:two-component system cell cycle response regulator DivK
MMKKRILYVEDHPNNRLLVQRIVEAEGMIFLTAVDGESGWQAASSQNPDLILMDLHLPGSLNGFELTQKIKNQAPLAHIPIIALSAFGNDEAEQAALAAGCVDFLRKPADIRQIRQTIHKYLEQAQPNLTEVESATAVTYNYI